MISPENYLKILASIGASVLLAGGTIIGKGRVESSAVAQSPKEGETSIVLPLKEWNPPAQKLIGRKSEDRHLGLMGVVLNQRGLKMFTPPLEEQAAQAGGILISTDMFAKKQIIPIEELGYLQRRRPGPRVDIFEPFGVIDHTPGKTAVAIMGVEVFNPKEGITETYYLMDEPGDVTEITSAPQTRWMLEILPTAIDRGDQIIAGEPSWAIRRITNITEYPQKLPSTGRR